MGVFLRSTFKAVAVSAMVMGVTYGAATVPGAAAAEAAAPAAAPMVVAAAAAGEGGAAADLLSVPVDLSSLVAERAGGGAPAGAKPKASRRGGQRKGAPQPRGQRKGAPQPQGKPEGAPQPGCEPVKAFLSTYYRVSWRLAMHTPNAAGAFQVFTLARRHAKSYLAANPRAKPAVVCVTPRLVGQVLPRVVAIMKRHQQTGGALPRAGYRNMTRAETVAMRKAVAVPLTKALPGWAVPKAVPMFV